MLVQVVSDVNRRERRQADVHRTGNVSDNRPGIRPQQDGRVRFAETILLICIERADPDEYPVDPRVDLGNGLIPEPEANLNRQLNYKPVEVLLVVSVQACEERRLRRIVFGNVAPNDRTVIQVHIGKLNWERRDRLIQILLGRGFNLRRQRLHA